MKKLFFTYLVLMLAFLLLPIFPMEKASANSAVVSTVAPGIIVRGGPSEVAMVEEEVSILAPSTRLPPEESNRATVSCSFLLENQGEKEETIQVGFPLSLLLPPSFPAFGSSVEDLKVKVDGQEITYDEAQEITNVEGTEVPLPWAVWEMSFSPGQKRLLEVNYSSCFDWHTESFVYYVLQTGATWKGKIGHGSISFFWDGLTSREQLFSLSIEPTRSDFKSEGTLLVWEFSDWEPDSDLYFFIMSPSWGKRVTSLLEKVQGSEGEASYHRQRGLAYLLGAMGPRFWEDRSIYYIAPRPSNFALLARTEEEFQKALLLEPENPVNYFLLGYARSLYRFRDEGGIISPDYKEALEMIEKGLAKDPSSHLGKFMESSVIIREAMDFLSRGEAENAEKTLQLVKDGVLPEASALILPVWQPSIENLWMGVPPKKVRVNTTIRGDLSGYREIEIVPGVSGNEDLFEMLSEFLPLSLLYTWDPENTDLKFPITYTASGIVGHWSFKAPEDVNILTSTLTIYDIPLQNLEARTLLELLRMGEIKKSGDSIHFQVTFGPLQLYDSAFFKNVSRDISAQTMFNEAYGFQPVPPLLKKTVLEAFHFWENQVILKTRTSELEMAFFYDPNNDGLPEFEKKFSTSLEAGLTVSFSFPEKEGRTWSAIVAAFLGILAGVLIAEMVHNRERKALLALSLIAVGTLVFGFFLLSRAVTLSWLEGLCAFLGATVSGIGQTILERVKTVKS